MQKDDDQHRRRDPGTTPLANYQKLAPVTDTFLLISNRSIAITIKRCSELATKGASQSGVAGGFGGQRDCSYALIRGYNDSWEAITGAIDYVQNWPNAAIFAESIYCRTTSWAQKV